MVAPGGAVGFLAALLAVAVPWAETEAVVRAEEVADLMLSEGSMSEQNFASLFLQTMPEDYVQPHPYLDETSIRLSNSLVGAVLSLKLRFIPKITLNGTDEIYVSLPRFTRGNARGQPGPSGALLQFSRTTRFLATWNEGSFDHSAMPFAQTNLTLQVRPGESMPAGDPVEVEIYEEEGIRAHCGFPADWEEIRIGTNASGTLGDNGQVMLGRVEQTGFVGSGCSWLLDCSGHGVCDHCKQRCECFEGYGGSLAGGAAPPPMDAAPDCTSRTCPVAPAVRSMPSTASIAHAQLLECGGNGKCDRASGECVCALGWQGEACQRRRCPNDCSGHGRCLAMEELAATPEALPLSGSNGSMYGSLDRRATKAWDFDKAFACVCDSSWEVGLGSGQVQGPEYFGPDCSLRRCPGGDDPRTPGVDETDCSNKSADGFRGRGQPGNLCHVDCSQRGICNHGTGTCACFEGYYGHNCGLVSAMAKQQDGDGDGGDGTASP